MKIKRVILACMLAVSFILPQTVSLAAPKTEESSSVQQVGEVDRDFTSKASLLMNLNTGEIYEERNIDEKVYPASTTKILTAILAIENGKLTDTVTVSDTASQLPSGSSGMGLIRGEELTVEQLLYGLMVSSANDAANALGEYVAGSIDDFVKMMNEKAKELGAVNTHFCNTNGLHDDDHYTTARDMAIIARYAMKNKTFRKLVKTASYTMEPTNKYLEQRIMRSTNKLLSTNKSSRYIYKNAIGIKTGFTTPAQHCLVSAADNGDFSLLCVVMGAPSDARRDLMYDETLALYKWGFSAYKAQTVAKEGETLTEAKVRLAKSKDTITLATQKEVKALLPTNIDTEKITSKISVNSDIKAPIKAGQVLGKVTYYYEGKKVATAKLVSNETIEQDNLLASFDKIHTFLTSPIFLIPVGIVVALVLALFIIRQINLNKRRKRRIMTRRRRYHR